MNVSFVSDGKYIVTSSTDKTAKIWKCRRCRLDSHLESHEDFVIGASFSSDDKYVVRVLMIRQQRFGKCRVVR